MADILIRGMEMPKDQHTITITICHDGYTVVEYRDNGFLMKEIETYKAIPLPEGHGEENERLKKQIVKLERKIMQMEEEAESNAAWERDFRNGQVQGMW